MIVAGSASRQTGGNSGYFILKTDADGIPK